MTPPGSATDAPTASRPLSIAILGADAVLAAVPATAVQLAHACLLVGYDAVVPASWGDELISAAVLRELRERDHAPAVQCSCPLVSRRLLSLGTELRPFLVSVVSPPVATARYLRTVHATTRLRITFVGRCPAAIDDDIDARISPEELLAMFADRRIALADQPTVFEDVIPPDRRRFRSRPGGVPRPEVLRELTGRELVELDGDSLAVELGQLLLTGRDVLVDLGPALGCTCSGARAGVATAAAEAHARVAEAEPPLSTGPVIDESVPVPLTAPVIPPVRPMSEVAAAVPVTPAADLWAPGDAAPLAPDGPVAGAHSMAFEAPASSLGADGIVAGPRRRSPGHGMRALVGPTPTARSAEGRQLPRTYLARRRSSPRGLRAMTGDFVSETRAPEALIPERTTAEAPPAAAPPEAPSPEAPSPAGRPPHDADAAGPAVGTQDRKAGVNGTRREGLDPDLELLTAVGESLGALISRLLRW